MTSMSNNILDYAIQYARAGWKIFPINKQKRPMFKGGHHRATSDEDQVSQWFSKDYPNANIALSLEDTSLFVMDIDNHKGQTNGFHTLETTLLEDGESLFSKLRHEPLMVVQTASGNGNHVYFTSDSPIVHQRKIDLWPSVDLLGANGYVVLPPSTFKGTSYKQSPTFDFHNIPEAPQWLLEAIEERLKANTENNEQSHSKPLRVSYPTSKPYYTATFMMDLIDGIHDGERNDRLTKVAGKLLALNMAPNYAYEWLHHINEHFVFPPLPEQEVNAIFSSILKAERNKLKQKGGA